ncbi:MAG: HlyC/CorC family transporter [Candidatus Melainabacteria bacterium]|nr:HlyC/CorC family transporter [Candidatus Melainabacteria bacterium]
MDSIIGISVGLFLILLNGLFVAVEFALARVNRTRIEQRVKEGHKAAALTLNALNKIDSYISAAQVGITISSLTLGAIAELTIAKLILPYISLLVSPSFITIADYTVALPVALLIVTYFHVVIGEIIPKTVAFVNPERTVFFLIWPLEIFKFLTSPLVWFLNLSASSILRLFGITDLRTTFVYTEDELKMLLNVSQEEGVLEESEKEMITNIFDFPDTVAREIMTPRTDIACIEANEHLEDAIKFIIESKHSRVPIYEGSIDNITGVITTRDLLEQIQLGNDQKPVKEIAKAVIKVPESKPIDDLLTELKRKSLQLAIVIDEFGGTSGLVTIEDIVEEIVGEIPDEFDTDLEPIQVLPNSDILLDGKLPIDEINEKLGTRFSKEHYDTIGGFTFGLIGKEPNVGDEVENNGYILKVEVKDKQRVKQVRLKKIQSAIKQENNKKKDKNNNNKQKKENKSDIATIIN